MKVTLIGCGIYSLGLAKLLTAKKAKITIWVHDKTMLSKLQKKYNYHFTTDINEAINFAEVIFIMVSSTYYVKIISQIKTSKPIFIGTKGILTQETLTNYTKKELKNNQVYFFCGPNLANDMLNNAKMGFSVSQKNPLLRELLPDYIDIDYPQTKIDLEVYSVYKNIIAIASGIIWQETKAYSTVLSFLTKAYQELTKTFKWNEILYGTIGDYFFTSTMQSSRNYQFGQFLVQSKHKAQNFLLNNTVEGYDILPIFKEYLANNHLKLKIIDILYDIIYLDKSISLLLNY